jgi:hypothetical protein
VNDIKIVEQAKSGLDALPLTASELVEREASPLDTLK